MTLLICFLTLFINSFSHGGIVVLSFDKAATIDPDVQSNRGLATCFSHISSQGPVAPNSVKGKGVLNFCFLTRSLTANIVPLCWSFDHPALVLHRYNYFQQVSSCVS
ncbi:conserved hypothetical protein, unlikely [Trypanosoma brucei gambiense DAL972]|uniref:Secreted protein n=2 Tax=Trypanosoma brucei TaxID=5691 RepID=Q38EA1_TRYB2|nr:conserved hypothetical protein, unlikely [Trypanosoma brucei gambiense DAL972]XP_827199.1 hypothetical protein, unlikely [Trypanosoma brucei brucei TREU927]EAN76869.1 hypothetical protein, unlikely [Trypanosoma brucei brucei TREU927]CBH14409.1 conserved hypothetical protein, unlikely [Trypanosoma brucei gambiense DAL972]|eukprot:XP_011776675.1 conserved hypothetical protein, unlikely [Trypanosoma brucei gambiense DAL972]